MVENNAETWAKFLVEDVFLDICGFPAVLRSDRGPEFVNEIIAAINQRLQVKHTFGAAFHPQSQGYIEGRHKAINNVLKAYAGKNKHHWATFSKLAQWSMRSTPRKDRGNKSPYEIVTGLIPQGPLDAVFARFSPESLTPSTYVNKLNEYLGQIRDQIARALDAEYKKRSDKNKGTRTNQVPQIGDLVFVRETPDAVQRIIDSKKKGEDTTSRRLLPYADPKLYRVSKVTDFGLYHLDDPATNRPAVSYRDAIPAERLIRYTELPPQERPLNADEEVWIEIKSNEVAKSDVWLPRKIEAQCDTGEVRICAADGSDSRVIDLTKFSYHFIKPPPKLTAIREASRREEIVEGSSDSDEDDE